MPKTTISVIFNGKDNGLSNLFNTLDRASSSLEQNFKKLESALDGVDQKLKSIKSNSSALSGLKIPVIPQQAQAKAQTASPLGANVASAYSGISTAASQLGSVLSTTGSLAKTTFSGVTSAITGSISGAYTNITNMVKYVDKAVLVFGNSVRQVAQGIQSFGIAFSIFVSAPIAGMLKGVVSESINFQDAMNKVRKTTLSTDADVATLGESLTQLSLTLPTAREDLAQIAEDWGSIGVRISDPSAQDSMTELVRLTDMLVNSTEGLTSANVVEKMGRFAAIYYPDVSTFVGEAEKLFSVLGALEDINPLHADQILSTLQRLAPVAATLGIPAEKAMAMAASVASVNASAERAGTQAGAALTQTIVNMDKVAEMFGTTEDKITSLMETSPDDFFYTIVSSLAALESPIKRVALATEIFGVTGAKSVLSLVNSIPNLSRNLEVANTEFAKGTYLQMQFTAALDSTKNQLAILRNNVTYAGSAIGDALLPYITKFVVLAVPAIQMLTEWFKSLGETVKVQVAGWMLLLAVAGPIVVFFSSLLFMVGLSISGLASLFSVVGMIVQGFIGFAGVVFALLSPVNLLVAALAGIAIYAVYLTNDLLMAQGIVQSYVSKFYSWGYNLISSFADGIASAGTAAYNAVMSVINAFIGLIQAFSPPKKGPLKDISKWGKGVMEAFADGIRSGGTTVAGVVSLVNESLKTILTGFDLSTIGTFTDAFSAIKSTISSVAAHIGLTSGETNARITEASNALALFIQNMKAGIPDDLKEIAGFLGGLGGDFENLIGLQLSYSNGAQRLNEIALALKGINTETDKLIAGVVTQEGLTNDQQSAMIRKIKLEQSLKEQSLTAEQNALQLQQDQLKNDIDKKQEIINILSGLIMPTDSTAGAGAIDPITGKVKEPKEEKPGITPIDMVPFQQASGAMGKLDEKFKAAGESAKTFTEKLGAAKLMIEGFVAAIRGDDKASYSEMPDEFWAGWEKGADVRVKVLDFMSKLDAAIMKIKNIKTVIDDAFFAFLVGYNAGKGGELNWDAIKYLNGLALAMASIGLVAAVSAKYIKNFVTSLFVGDDDKKSGFEIALDRILKAYTAFKNGFAETTSGIDWESTGNNLKIIGTGLGVLLTSESLWKGIGKTLGASLVAISEMISGLAELTLVLAAIFGADVKKEFGDLYASLGKNTEESEKFREKGEAVYQTWKNVGDGARQTAKDYETLSGSISRLWEQAKNDTQENGLAAGIKTFLLDPIMEGFTDFSDSVEKWWNDNPWSPKNWADSILSGMGIKKPEGQNVLSSGGEKDVARDGGTGGKIASGLLDGFTGFLKSKQTEESIKESISTALASGQINSTEGTKFTGELIGGSLYAGLKTFLENPTPTGFVMGAMVAAQELWRSTLGRPLFMSNGDLIGADVISGLDARFKTDTTYMPTFLGAFGQWVLDNFKLIVEKGKDIGSWIIKGITDSISGSVSSVWDALKGVLDDLYDKLPFWFKIWIGDDEAAAEHAANKSRDNAKPPPSGEPEVTYVEPKPKDRRLSITDGVFLPQSGTLQPNTALALTINIDNSGGGSVTRQTVDYLVDKVYARLIKDTRLLG